MDWTGIMKSPAGIAGAVLFALTAILAVLKMLGLIGWPWLAVFSPAIVALVGAAVLVVWAAIAMSTNFH